MANAWMEHLTNVRKNMPGLSLKEAMKKAKKTYKKITDKLPGKTKKHHKSVKHTKKHRGSKKHNKKGGMSCNKKYKK